MAKLSAFAIPSTPADSASDTDSGPLLLPAKGEAVSSTSVCDEETTGKEAPRPSASGLNTRLRQALTSASPVTVGAFKLPWPGRGKSAPSNGSSSSTAPCCSKAGCELAGSCCLPLCQQYLLSLARLYGIWLGCALCKLAGFNNSVATFVACFVTALI